MQTGRRATPSPDSRGGQRGAVLLMVLVFVLGMTLAAGTLVQSYQTETQREREEELLFVGDQYRRAIASYANTVAPGGARSLPQSLEDLLHDNRFPTPRRHLRRLYPDPMTGQADWVLVRSGTGIIGVHSRSERQPLKQSGFPQRYQFFERQPRYAGWVFAAMQR